MELKVIQQQQENEVARGTYASIDLQLPDYDCDIGLLFPNGKRMELQYRVEAPSIDICLPRALSVTNWWGDDMEPAKPVQKNDPRVEHVRNAKQLVIDFPPEWLHCD